MWSHLLKDKQFWLAVSAALPVWAFVFVQGSVDNVVYPARETFDSFLLVVLVYPIVEELCFRGALQSYLIRKTRFSMRTFGLSRANLFVSILFTGLHVLVQLTPVALLVFFPSLIFGHFRDRYQSVVPAVLLHIFYNFGWLIALISH